jgi:hypothetical protein
MGNEIRREKGEATQKNFWNTGIHIDTFCFCMLKECDMKEKKDMNWWWWQLSQA